MRAPFKLEHVHSHDIKSISFGTDHTLVLSDDYPDNDVGVVWARGSNKYGQLGNGGKPTSEAGWNEVVDNYGRGKKGLLLTENEQDLNYAAFRDEGMEGPILVASTKSVSIAGIHPEYSNQWYRGAGDNSYRELLQEDHS
ncbi:hypothetical protein GEMRC1_013917 [Eukaryota sp. GEM-RC1]